MGLRSKAYWLLDCAFARGGANTAQSNITNEMDRAIAHQRILFGMTTSTRTGFDKMDGRETQRLEPGQSYLWIEDF